MTLPPNDTFQISGPLMSLASAEKREHEMFSRALSAQVPFLSSDFRLIRSVSLVVDLPPHLSFLSYAFANFLFKLLCLWAA